MSTEKNTYLWETTNSPVASSRTDDIWFFDDETGWLVNSSGEVCKTINGGVTWDRVTFIDPALPSKPYLRCMGWSSREVGWIGAVTQIRDPDIDNPSQYRDVLLHRTVDGGANWNPVKNLPENSPPGICGFFAVNDKVVYGAGTNDPALIAPGTKGPSVIKSTDGGDTWRHIDMSKHASNLIDVFFTDELTGWVVGGLIDKKCPAKPKGYEDSFQYAQLRAVVLKTTDGGDNWTNMAEGVEGLACGEWGWKIQFLPGTSVGFVSLENMVSAAILITTDGGDSWTRLPVADSAGKVINKDLEGIGFIDPSTGWVGGWGDNFKGLQNSFTEDGGRTWITENHVPNDPDSDQRIRINRYRYLNQPVTTGYCSGLRVYKLFINQPEAAQQFRDRVSAEEAASKASPFDLSAQPLDGNPTSTKIQYTLEIGAESVYIGIWNHFAVHVKTVFKSNDQGTDHTGSKGGTEHTGSKGGTEHTGPKGGTAQTGSKGGTNVTIAAGRYTVVWDGTNDDNEPVGPGVYICRLCVNGDTGETVNIVIPST